MPATRDTEENKTQPPPPRIYSPARKQEAAAVHDCKSMMGREERVIVASGRGLNTPPTKAFFTLFPAPLLS